MSQTNTTLTAKEIMHAYGEWHEASKGFHVLVEHPKTGKFVAVSGGQSSGDEMILATFTGRVEKFYDEHGEHDSPHFTGIVEDGAIPCKADDVFNVRNAR